jgi:hypothetical protein
MMGVMEVASVNMHRTSSTRRPSNNEKLRTKAGSVTGSNAVTVDEIREALTLPAGREIDTIIHERILQLGCAHDWMTVSTRGRRARVACRKCSIRRWGSEASGPDAYSTNDSAAMWLLYQWTGDFSTRRQNTIWKVVLFQTSRQWESWAETLPLAICRAAIATGTEIGCWQKVLVTRIGRLI